MINLINKILYKFDYRIKKIRPEYKSIDYLLKDKIKKNPIIFDVGANKGQSIKRFNNIFKSPTIHAFEPIKSQYEIMVQEFKRNKKVYLNNYALGERKYFRRFNITKKTENSSFLKLNLKTDWIKERSLKTNTSPKKYVVEKPKVKISTVDKYFIEKKIRNIDLLKIDTQGYEEKVLEGSIKSLKNNKITAIEVEIMFDNNYEKNSSFYNIEKIILPYNFRLVAIQLINNNVFKGLGFSANAIYFNQRKIKI